MCNYLVFGMYVDLIEIACKGWLVRIGEQTLSIWLANCCSSYDSEIRACRVWYMIRMLSLIIKRDKSLPSLIYERWLVANAEGWEMVLSFTQGMDWLFLLLKAWLMANRFCWVLYMKDGNQNCKGYGLNYWFIWHR